MWDAVSLSNDNITTAMETIEVVHGKVASINSTIATLLLRHQVLSKDPTTYFDTMLKALDLTRELHNAIKKREPLSFIQEAEAKLNELKKAI